MAPARSVTTRRIGSAVPLSRLQKEHRALGGHFPCDAVSNRGMTNDLVGGEHDLGGDPVRPGNPIDLRPPHRRPPGCGDLRCAVVRPRAMRGRRRSRRRQEANGSSDDLRIGAIGDDLEAQRVSHPVRLVHRRAGVGEGDGGDPVGLQGLLGLPDGSAETDIGDVVADETDRADGDERFAGAAVEVLGALPDSTRDRSPPSASARTAQRGGRRRGRRPRRRGPR